jgi:DNA mismatch repair protein MutL
MPKVCVLPEHIASQIAAGEVVERPSSVVKELAENSIDAGATKIHITLSESCRSIRVADNGCGMEPEDAVLAFQRHATSKLRSADELWQLNTLGFRGEALPSIASVSHLTCYTRTADSTTGTRVESADGTLKAVETGCAVGTIIEITDLFYNVPARLKFLKQAQTEFAHIHETVQSLAIAYPEISFELFNDRDLKLSTSGSGSFTEVLFAARHFANIEDIIEIKAADESLGLSIEARISGAKHFRGDRKGILSIVNQRPVRCSLTYKALDYAYADLIPRGRYPLAAVHLRVKPDELDINIHPTKKEIKYARGNEVYSFIQRQIVSALRGHRVGAINIGSGNFNPAERASNLIAGSTSERGAAAMSVFEQLDFKPGLQYRNESNIVRSGLVSEPGFAGADGTSALPVVSARFGSTELSDRAGRMPALPGTTAPIPALPVSDADGTSAPPVVSRGFASNENFGSADAGRMPALPGTAAPTHALPVASTLPSDWKVVGYVHNTYILLQTIEGLAIVEQHIAHERTLYERLLAQQSESITHSENNQRLIISCPLKLTAEQTSCVEQNRDSLAELGFEFESIATESSEPFEQPASRSMPQPKLPSTDATSRESFACTQVPLELAHQDYPSVIQSILQELSESTAPNIKLEITKSIACQSAIKNGMPLSDSAIFKLLTDWHATPRNETCPHGRPIKLDFSMAKLFQLFHPA